MRKNYKKIFQKLLTNILKCVIIDIVRYGGKKNMKYWIEEMANGARFYYDDEYDSIEEAIKVIDEYKIDDKDEPSRQSVTYYVVDDNGKVVYIDLNDIA